jgi:4-azaleucine resistance transporter AzlC
MINNSSNSHLSSNYFKEGLKSGIPIALGYIPIAIAFGLLTKTNGLPNYVAILMSLFVFAGASQFIGVSLLALGTSPIQIVTTTFILNFRHFLMSSSLALRIQENVSKSFLSLLSFGITDETFSVASLRDGDKLHPNYILGLNLIAFTAWNLGTIIGVFAAVGLPKSIADSMGIALYAMFIGLLLPSIKKSLPLFLVALTAILGRSMLHWIPMFSGISKGWQIIIATIIGAGFGAFFFDCEVKDNE